MNKISNFLKKRCLLTVMIIVAMACSAFAQVSKVATIGYKNSTVAVAPTFNTTPTATTVDYGNLYSYRATATWEGALETTITAPTLPPWMTLTLDGAGNAALFGNIPSGVSINGIAGDDNGNIFTISQDGSTIYKIAQDGTTTLWRSGLISGNYYVYDLHIANGYIYIPRHGDASYSITRIPLNNPSAAEENFASLPGGAISLTHKDGFIYASNYTYGQIWKINETTKAQSILLTIPVNNCMGLTFDYSGNLFITTYGGASILKYNGSSVTPVLSGLPYVSSIRVDAQGNFYVSSYYSGGLRKYTADFSSYEVVSPTGTESVWNSTLTSNGSVAYSIYASNQVYRLQRGVIIQGTPAKSDVGDHPVVLRAANSAGYTEQNFTITVEDNVGPVITTYSPVRNSTEIDLHPTLSITFDEEVSLGATGTFDIYNGATLVKSFDLSVPAERALLVVSPDQKTVSLTPTENLPHYTLLSVGISAGFVKDVYDNNFIGFTSASNTWRFTTMNKFDQTITYPVIASKTYGNAPFTLGDANTNRGLTVTYTAEDPTVVSITGNQATILKAGNTKITATQIGDYYDFALTPIERTLEVTKAPLTVTADAKTKCYDAAVYSGYTVTYTGFVNGEDQTVLGGALTFNGTAIDAVNPDTYSI
ncbi:MAG: Ig-like domain-containing protein, partial [Prolixibacteraceae bacterium]|nr:Ig-like domain-containing protein [Prolixibacteraceae bacterium]